MIPIPRTIGRLVAGAALGLALSVAPAAAAETRLAGSSCVLPPGVYGITDSSGTLVGILIVYPDCRMEVYTGQNEA